MRPNDSGLCEQLNQLFESFDRSSTNDVILSLLGKAAECLGATSSYFASFERDEKTSGSLSLLLACDPLWGLEYEREGCFIGDPWLAYCRVNSEPVKASQISYSDDVAAAFIRRAETHGFRSAIVAPAPSPRPSDSLGMLVLGHEEPGHFDHFSVGLAKLATRGLAMELREKLSALARRQVLAGTSLSTLELNLLRLANQGLSSKAIGKAIGLSSSAVDMRFHRLNSKLRCPHRKSSSRFAASCGLI